MINPLANIANAVEELEESLEPIRIIVQAWRDAGKPNEKDWNTRQAIDDLRRRYKDFDKDVKFLEDILFK